MQRELRDRKRVLFYHPDLANNCKPLPGILAPIALRALVPSSFHRKCTTLREACISPLVRR